MEIKYKNKLIECTEIGCANISQCEDGCMGWVPNKCIDCELRRLVINIKTQQVRSYCPYCPHDELGNNAEPIKEYPDDPDDNYDEDYDDDSELGGHYTTEPWEHVR